MTTIIAILALVTGMVIGFFIEAKLSRAPLRRTIEELKLAHNSSVTANFALTRRLRQWEGDYEPTVGLNPRNVVIDYTNWRGQRYEREIMPGHLVFRSTEYHKEPQWLLHAFDVNKAQARLFSMKDIHAWKEPETPIGHTS